MPFKALYIQHNVTILMVEVGKQLTVRQVEQQNMCGSETGHVVFHVAWVEHNMASGRDMSWCLMMKHFNTTFECTLLRPTPSASNEIQYYILEAMSYCL
jgi:hypothetical protein